MNKRSRDAHDIKEMAHMLNGLFNLATQLRVMADDVENKTNMIQTRMESIAKDILGIANGT